MNQKVLIMSTDGDHVRSNAQGWSCDDGDLVVAGKPIGFTPSPLTKGPPYSYECPLFALGDGWQLLAPPIKHTELDWEWWFVRVNSGTEERNTLVDKLSQDVLVNATDWCIACTREDFDKAEKFADAMKKSLDDLRKLAMSRLP